MYIRNVHNNPVPKKSRRNLPDVSPTHRGAVSLKVFLASVPNRLQLVKRNIDRKTAFNHKKQLLLSAPPLLYVMTLLLVLLLFLLAAGGGIAVSVTISFGHGCRRGLSRLLVLLFLLLLHRCLRILNLNNCLVSNLRITVWLDQIFGIWTIQFRSAQFPTKYILY